MLIAMDCAYEMPNKMETVNNRLQIIKHPLYQASSKFSSSWLDLRVIYVRISNFVLDDSTPEFLTLNHIPFDPDTLLEVNGSRCGLYSDGVASVLKRDRVDKKTEEATFVCTDNIRLTGSLKFEVFDKEDLILSGVLERSPSNGFVGDADGHSKQWSMNCESEMAAGKGFLRGKNIAGPELLSPTIEVYIAGCYLGTPIMLTKTLQLSHRKKNNRKGTLDAIPEYETSESQKDAPSNLDLQVEEFRSYKPDSEQDYNTAYWRTEYMDGEDGELSWFNAGVRVGVGIGLGVCVGLGIGVGLMVRTYQSATRNFKRRLI